MLITRRRVVRAVRNRTSPVRRVSRDRLADELAFDALDAPADLVGLGRHRGRRSWLASYVSPPGGGALGHREPPKFTERRIWGLVRFLRRWVQPRLPDRSWWALISVHDGWREFSAYSDRYRWVDPQPGLDTWHGAPGEIPRLSATQPWLLCFAAHTGDPSAVVVPESPWLVRGDYAEAFSAIAAGGLPWNQRQPRAIYRGGDHGHPWNVLRYEELGTRHSRALLQDVVAAEGLDVDVQLGGAKFSTVDHQMTFRYILDIDGYARSTDAWAWKMASGSVVLAQTSIWRTYFPDRFQPWEHYVPVANDLTDLGERLEWCRSNDRECQEIATRAAARAAEVYRHEPVAEDLAATLQKKLWS